MKHAGVDLLLFDILRFLKVLHSLYELLNPSIHLIVFSGEHTLEMLISDCIYLIGRPSSFITLGEQLPNLISNIVNFLACFLGNVVIIGDDWGA